MASMASKPKFIWNVPPSILTILTLRWLTENIPGSQTQKIPQTFCRSVAGFAWNGKRQTWPKQQPFPNKMQGTTGKPLATETWRNDHQMSIQNWPEAPTRCPARSMVEIADLYRTRKFHSTFGKKTALSTIQCFWMFWGKASEPCWVKTCRLPPTPKITCGSLWSYEWLMLFMLSPSNAKNDVSKKREQRGINVYVRHHNHFISII